MQQYHDLLNHIIDNGHLRGNRTGIRTFSIFGYTMKFDLTEKFPIITTKKVNFDAVKAELVGFLLGVDNAKSFRELGTKIWDANANEEKGWLSNPERKGEDDLGRIYGVQWRGWQKPAHGEQRINPLTGRSLGLDLEYSPGGKVDQIFRLVRGLMNDPYGRRHLVTAWNPGELHQMALPPCHYAFQCYVRDDGDTKYLDMMVHMRSVDAFLGLPFNIASYALLTHMIAHVTGMEPGELTMTLGDTHIYENHLAHVLLQLRREEIDCTPNLRFGRVGDDGVFSRCGDIYALQPCPNFTSIDDIGVDEIQLTGYQYHPALKGEMAV